MRKKDEIRNEDSCLNRADYKEMLFVLLARDIAAPDTIRYWINRRIQLGKNSPDDPQILEAERCAQIMEEEQAREYP
jgi:hypothetical protein